MRVAILLLGFGLVACADPEAIRVAQGAQDDAKCQSYGAKPGTQPYFDCRKPGSHGFRTEWRQQGLDSHADKGS